MPFIANNKNMNYEEFYNYDSTKTDGFCLAILCYVCCLRVAYVLLACCLYVTYERKLRAFYRVLCKIKKGSEEP